MHESALKEALETFVEINECTYANKSLGASRQLETISCDCPRVHRQGPLCEDDSDCINRETCIECYGATACESRCKNRRFQNKEWAKIDVFNAGEKGYGVQALEPIKEAQLVYEYVGEVIDKQRFERRRQTYHDEGVPHFYFMMLQKDEFIDATKKGGIARFLNHSCNPNCVVSKWIVGPKLRMGIFSVRDIAPGEELTFDYNVDRFGGDAQKCLCGEPNCRGVLSGKSQTFDLIPGSLADILGVTDDVIKELRADKSLKKKKDLDLDIISKIPTTPVPENEIRKIVTFLMQPQEEFVVQKVVERIHATKSKEIQGEIMKMHGYELFGSLLSQWGKTSPALTLEILKVLLGWPRVTKNKISSAEIEPVVSELTTESDNDDVVHTAKELLAEWAKLEMGYRIRRQKKGDTPEVTEPKEMVSESKGEVKEEKKTELVQPKTPNVGRLPPGWNAAYAEDGTIYYYNRELNSTTWERPKDSRDEERAKRMDEERRAREAREYEKQQQEKLEQAKHLQRIIDEAAAKTASTGESPADTPGSSDTKQSEKKDPKTVLAKQISSVLATYVTKSVFKYEEQLNHERCKRHAREITHILVEKELKKGVTEFELTDEKKKKIKGFIHDYMKKVLNHHGKRPNSETHKSKKRLKV